MFTIQKDGFCLLQDSNYGINKTDLMPCQKLMDDVFAKLPHHYVFLNYVYIIQHSALYTFHRDVTSSQHIYKTQHPVYTMIFYQNEGELISVCPHSNTDYPFVFSQIVNINSKGCCTAVLFDSELLHAGRMNGCKEKRIVQYKLCHIDDIWKLRHLHDVFTETSEVCNENWYKHVLRKMSYYFQLPIHLFAYPLMIRREDTNTLYGTIQAMLPLQYYNKGNLGSP
jgi:hypothetical protein